MTKGILLYFGRVIYETCEFKGDMSPVKNGDEITRAFKSGDMTSAKSFVDFIERFNRKHYTYEQRGLIVEYKTKDYLLRKLNRYSTDYLYIVNETNETINIADEKILPHTMGIISGQLERIVTRKAINAKEFYQKALVDTFSYTLMMARDNSEYSFTDEEIDNLLDSVRKKVHGKSM